jgi:hypothetical protein
MASPTRNPDMKMPVAIPRCDLSNCSVTTLVAAGKFADSPTPINMRLIKSVPLR